MKATKYGPLLTPEQTAIISQCATDLRGVLIRAERVYLEVEERIDDRSKATFESALDYIETCRKWFLALERRIGE